MYRATNAGRFDIFASSRITPVGFSCPISCATSTSASGNLFEYPYSTNNTLSRSAIVNDCAWRRPRKRLIDRDRCQPAHHRRNIFAVCCRYHDFFKWPGWINVIAAAVAVAHAAACSARMRCTVDTPHPAVLAIFSMPKPCSRSARTWSVTLADTCGRPNVRPSFTARCRPALTHS